MTKLYELAKLIRSKNAGPFELTFDVMFEDESAYSRVRDGNALTRATVARLYGLKEQDVRVMSYDAALAIKITIPRPHTSGDLSDGDVYGGQQYAPLVDIDV